MNEHDATEVVELLKSYAVYENAFFANNYGVTFFDKFGQIAGVSNEECQKKMDFIKMLINSLAPSNMATLLNLHYVNRLSVEKSATCMMMSKRTAYRLLDRVHIAINNRYQRMKGGAE